MANPEHLKLVKQGTQTLTSWQQENPDAVLDLEGADLSGVNLVGARIRNANLKGANLSKSEFLMTDFSFADQRGTKLDKTDQRGTKGIPKKYEDDED